MQDKPNSSIADCGLGTDLRRDTLRGPPGRGPVVQTNPISGQGPVGRGLGDRGRGANAPNKPNFQAEPGGTKLRGRRTRVLYKQTQSAGAESAKQSQFAEPPGGLAASCTNKANSRHGAKTGKGFLGKDLW
jgi:hypothetical protein